MQKILHIPNYYKPHLGGIEQTCYDIVESISEVCKQKVICFSEDHLTKYETIDGVDVIKCGVWKKILSQSISFSYKKELKKIINDFEPDCIILHFPNPFVQHYLLKQLKRKNTKLIVWYHSDIIKQKFVRLFFKRQTRKLLLRAEQIVCTSPSYSQGSLTLQKFQDKVKVIPSCVNDRRLVVDSDVEQIAKNIRDCNREKIIVFAIGRHVTYKGLTYLIKSSKYLSDKYAIFIAGEGPLTQELMAQAKSDSKITFLGKIDDITLKAYYLAMDILAFPSITKNEAFGLALAEGMYFKHPAITFTIQGSGVNYVNLKDVTGLEVENENACAFAKAIEALGNDEKLREKMGLAASQRVKNLFIFEKFKLKVKELLELEESKGDENK